MCDWNAFPMTIVQCCHLKAFKVQLGINEQKYVNKRALTHGNRYKLGCPFECVVLWLPSSTIIRQLRKKASISYFEVNRSDRKTTKTKPWQINDKRVLSSICHALFRHGVVTFFCRNAVTAGVVEWPTNPSPQPKQRHDTLWPFPWVELIQNDSV